VRTGREVRLTDGGAALLDGARRTLAESEAAVTAARRAGAGEVGSLRIGYNWSARFDTLPALGQALKRTYPDVELLAEEMRPSRMPAALRAGTIDVALALYPEVVDGLAYKTVRREPIVALLSANHPLAHENAVGLEALADDFLMFPRELAPRLHDFYVRLCRGAGFEPNVSGESARSRWTIGTWEASTAALLPASVSDDPPNGVVAVPISGLSEALEVQLAWRYGNHNPALAAFLALADGVFAPMPHV
jgi:DNA-binding transcriptional LysR family regulator